MLLATFAALASDVLAMGSHLGDFKRIWWESNGCAATLGQGWPPEWEASGNCDFSSEEDPLMTAALYCEDNWYASAADCEDEYPAFLVSWNQNNMSESDPCYGAWTGGECWFGYVNWSTCDAGEQSSWSMGCGGWNWCMCGK
jgi:hypothetical protein